MNRKKTAGLLAAVLGVTLALTGCGEVKVNVEVGDSLPKEFQGYGENGDVESTVSIENVDYTIEDTGHSDNKEVNVEISGKFTYVDEEALLVSQEVEIQLLDEKGNPVPNIITGGVDLGTKEGDSYENRASFTVSKSGTYTIRLAEKSKTEE